MFALPVNAVWLFAASSMKVQNFGTSVLVRWFGGGVATLGSFIAP
jgi:hypothetical protein